MRYLIVMLMAFTLVACKNDEKHYTQIKIADTIVDAKISATLQERQTGLQFVNKLGNNEGMLFIYHPPKVLFHWMKDTLIPLDLIWIGHNKKIIKISANLLPCMANPCPLYSSDGLAEYVLEVNAGFSAQHQLKVGMPVEF